MAEPRYQLRPVSVGALCKRLKCQLKDLQEIGKIALPGNDPSMWDNIDENTEVPLSSMSVILTAMKLAGSLTPEDLGNVCHQLIGHIRLVPEIMVNQLNGVDLKPVVLTLLDGQYAMVLDVEDKPVFYDIKAKQQLDPEEMNERPVPIESYSICLTQLLLRLFHDLILVDTQPEQTENAPKETPKNKKITRLPDPDEMPRTGKAATGGNTGKTIENSVFNPRNETTE